MYPSAKHTLSNSFKLLVSKGCFNAQSVSAVLTSNAFQVLKYCKRILDPFSCRYVNFNDLEIDNEHIIH